MQQINSKTTTLFSVYVETRAQSTVLNSTVCCYFRRWIFLFKSLSFVVLRWGFAARRRLLDKLKRSRQSGQPRLLLTRVVGLEKLRSFDDRSFPICSLTGQFPLKREQFQKLDAPYKRVSRTKPPAHLELPRFCAVTFPLPLGYRTIIVAPNGQYPLQCFFFCLLYLFC